MSSAPHIWVRLERGEAESLVPKRKHSVAANNAALSKIQAALDSPADARPQIPPEALSAAADAMHAAATSDGITLWDRLAKIALQAALSNQPEEDCPYHSTCVCKEDCPYCNPDQPEEEQ